MRRGIRASTLAALGALAALGWARGEDVELRYSLRARHTPVVGERWFTEVEGSSETRTTDSPRDKAPRQATSTRREKARLVHEALAVDAGEVQKERVTIESFLLERGSGPLERGDGSAASPPADRSLEKKTVLVEGVGDSRRATLEDVTGVSSAAAAWCQIQLGPRPDKDGLARFLPEEAVVKGARWHRDPEALAKAIFRDARIDRETSTIWGHLVDVKKREDGVPVATVLCEGEVHLATLPGTATPWREGGVLGLRVEIEESLDPARRHVVGTISVNLAGKYDAGAVEVSFETHQRTTQREGLLPAR